jgi:integrase
VVRLARALLPAPLAEYPKRLRAALSGRSLKFSTKIKYAVEATTILEQRDPRNRWKGVKPLLKQWDLRLCWEDAKKAPTWSRRHLNALMQAAVAAKDAELCALWAIMIPTGARHRDVLRLRKEDVTLHDDQTLTMLVGQTKTIRARRHQRRVTTAVPPTLWRFLKTRWRKCKTGERLTTVTYERAMRELKKIDPSASTYTLRLTAFQHMARRVNRIEEMLDVTLHRDVNSLRQYLARQLPDELRSQRKLTAWVRRLSV